MNNRDKTSTSKNSTDANCPFHATSKLRSETHKQTCGQTFNDDSYEDAF